MKFIELLCTRLRWTTDQVEQVILQDLPGRLASALDPPYRAAPSCNQ